MIKSILKKTNSGITLMEVAATTIVVGIIALGMTSAAQAVILHYQTDTVRQDLRQYGNNILREISRELNLAQKIEIDGQNGFSRIKLYDNFTDISPYLNISCNRRNGIEFNSEAPLNGVLRIPSEGAFRGNGQREVFVRDFVVENDVDTRPSLALFKNSYIHITLILGMESDVMDEAREIQEEHTFHRTVFLGTSYIQNKVTNALMGDDDV
tara:strand:+ start:307 stop:939 length:633 start_codon:yes stop_codon:yes gene_type:complete